MNRIGLLLTLLLLAACSQIRGFIESQFTLEPDSRLPKWFSVPVGQSRSSVTVELTYYSPPWSIDDTVIELVGTNGRTLSQLTGKVCLHPIMEKKRNQHGGFDSDSYPHYVYIRANGVLEVIEHVHGPTFRVTDDPMLVKAALESNHCAH